jgi:hypothetical protein
MRFCLALAAVSLVSCGGGGSTGYQLDRELASAIPADTVTLAGGRVDLIQKSPLYSKLPTGATDGFASQFGLDPRKDIKEFVEDNSPEAFAKVVDRLLASRCAHQDCIPARRRADGI